MSTDFTDPGAELVGGGGGALAFLTKLLSLAFDWSELHVEAVSLDTPTNILCTLTASRS